MKYNELVSVIIPIYNADTYIEKCIESILHQSYTNIEIILVNDGSIDKSEIICKSFDDSRIKYIYKQNGGVSSARNEGVKNAIGKYIIFVDADDYLDVDSIKTLMEYKKTMNLIALPVRMIKNNKITESFIKYQHFERQEYTKKIINGEIGGFCWGYLFETNIVKNINFDIKIKYMEDTLFLFEYLKKSNVEKIIIPVQNNYYNYVNNSKSATNNNSNIIEKVNNMFSVLNKINKITDCKYNVLIEDKKIRLLETEMRFLRKSKEFKNIINKIQINNYSTIKIRYTLFYYLYTNKIVYGLQFYYLVRRIAKKGGAFYEKIKNWNNHIS